VSANACGSDPALLIDLPATERAELEGALSRGAVVVRYDACRLEVLPACEAPASYAYQGVSVKRERMTIDNSGGLGTRLGLGGRGAGGAVSVDDRFDVDLGLVGQYQLESSSTSRAQLRGACQGATHVVERAQVGAFALFASSGGSGEVDVGAPAGSAAAGLSHRRALVHHDGDLDACQSARRTDPAPPANCSAPLRVALEPLIDAPAPVNVARARRVNPTPQPQYVEPQPPSRSQPVVRNHHDRPARFVPPGHAKGHHRPKKHPGRGRGWKRPHD
jgi:hypothetical protein